MGKIKPASGGLLAGGGQGLRELLVTPLSWYQSRQDKKVTKGKIE
jgi:hypothetical protein